ncbi:hypothetical protein [Mesorhizobium sp. M0619]
MFDVYFKANNRNVTL